VVFSLLLAPILIGVDPARGGGPVPSANRSLTADLAVAISLGWPDGAARPDDAARPDGAATPAAPAVVRAGAGTFAFASGPGQVAGQVGPVVQYRVAVEDGVGVTADAFAVAVAVILGDARSWTAGRMLRLQRVAATEPAQFTIYLASPVTSEAMCREDWLETGGYTNCRLQDGRVVINSARWLTAVPDYGAPLETYQAYAVNHEVGHQLGFGHELCPEPGLPAPVMQQQTLGMDGCGANGWPYLAGQRYAGPPSSR
jgi:hypothetical protein